MGKGWNRPDCGRAGAPLEGTRRAVRAIAAHSAVAIGLVLSACGDEATNTNCVDGPVATVAGTSYAGSLQVDLAQMTEVVAGVFVRDRTIGTGDEAMVGSLTRVTYAGWLADGRQFDSGQNFQFQLGAGQVILGWDRGVQGMRVGGVRQLVLSPNAAYGLCGIGPIPGNSVLVFDVELTGVG